MTQMMTIIFMMNIDTFLLGLKITWKIFDPSKLDAIGRLHNICDLKCKLSIKAIRGIVITKERNILGKANELKVMSLETYWTTEKWKLANISCMKENSWLVRAKSS